MLKLQKKLKKITKGTGKRKQNPRKRKDENEFEAN